MLRLGSWTLILALMGGCDGASLSEDVASDEGDSGPLALGKADGVVAVNGYQLTSQQQRWLRYVADHVVSVLPGARDRQIQIASRAAWWSLKEGIFDTKNAPAYSNCNFASGDRLIGLLDTCTPNRAWQVGLAAVQVPNFSLTELQVLATQLYPQQTVDEVLADAAGEAGLAPGSGTTAAIISSQGSLRKSWLLRNSAIGFTAVEKGEVVPECINGSKGWCYGRGWEATRRYAPTKTAALRAMADLAALLEELTGGGKPASPWIGSPCQNDTGCPYAANGSQGLCHTYLVGDGSAAGFCSLPCEGLCPDQAGSAKTFCVSNAAGGGRCAAVAGPLNNTCADLPGTRAQELERYVGGSGVATKTASVCLP